MEDEEEKHPNYGAQEEVKGPIDSRVSHVILTFKVSQDIEQRLKKLLPVDHQER